MERVTVLDKRIRDPLGCELSGQESVQSRTEVNQSGLCGTECPRGDLRHV